MQNPRQRTHTCSPQGYAYGQTTQRSGMKQAKFDVETLRNRSPAASSQVIVSL
jgi:hypothetical protein